MGGTDDPSNLLTVNIALHALLHKILWEEHGRWQDYAAWKGLSGQAPWRVIDEEIESARRQKISDAMKGRIFDDETRQRMSNSAKKRCATEEGKLNLIEAASLGGIAHKGFIHKEETKKEHSLRMKDLWDSGAYGKNRNKKISEAHIGKKWYNNGEIEYRYKLNCEPHGFVLGRLKKER